MNITRCILGILSKDSILYYTFRHLQEKGYQATSKPETSVLPELWRKRTGLLLSGPKSSFQMKVNVAFNLEIKVPGSGERVERHRINVA